MNCIAAGITTIWLMLLAPELSLEWLLNIVDIGLMVFCLHQLKVVLLGWTKVYDGGSVLVVTLGFLRHGFHFF